MWYYIILLYLMYRLYKYMKFYIIPYIIFYKLYKCLFILCNNQLQWTLDDKDHLFFDHNQVCG